MFKRNEIMKKEYLILIILILSLGAYLFYHKENKDHYALPEIKKLDLSKISGLILETKKGSIQFNQKDKNWTLTDKEYPADSSSVKNMLDTLKTFKLSTLVSQKGDLIRYELDDDHQIQVKALNGNNTIFGFTIGKTAPSFNHTFVMIKGDKNIYHAAGSFRSYFDKTVEDFRDKKVLTFKEPSIKRFSIEKDGLSKTLISKEGKKGTDETTITWYSKDGTSVEKEAVTNLLSTLSALSCEKYLDSKSKNELEKEKSLCKINLENGAKINLSLFSTEENDLLKGLSSMNNYAFQLSQFNGKEIVSNIDKILGITKTEDKEE